MNEAPKKIWVKAELSGLLHAGYTDYMGGNEYIRADLVDGSVAACKTLTSLPEKTDCWLETLRKAVQEARAALKALEE